MAQRPSLSDVQSQSHGLLNLHVAGDVPPELSPLDAFAAQSRLLAQQLEQDRSKGGRRVSRLPPLTIEKSFANRPAFFRSVSAGEPATSPNNESSSAGSGTRTEIEAVGFRPVSVYPLVGHVPPSMSTRSPPRFGPRDEEQTRGRQSSRPLRVFNTHVEQSPSPVDRESAGWKQGSSSTYFHPRPSMESMRQRDHSSRRPLDSSTTRGHDSRVLALPRSPFARQPSNINSMSVEDSEEDIISTSLSASFVSDPPKFTSGNTLADSPISPPFIHSIPRSSSFSSDFSAGDSRLSRPTFNFSRPMSRASEPPMDVIDVPSRQASSDSQPFLLADDAVHTPVSIHGEELPDNGQTPILVPSYVYSRFILPRGKMLQRSSGISQENLRSAEFPLEHPSTLYTQPHASSKVPTPPSPASRPSTSSLGQMSSTSVSELSDLYLDRPSAEQSQSRQKQNRNDKQDILSPNINSHTNANTTATPSIASGSTIKPPFLPPSADLSAEEHVTKGIDCHERGSLNESTYHLRIAARQNHPTGMLLYALACRHGWGMRPNQREGVQWLRKAAEFAILEVTDDEDLAKGGRPADALEQKARKAQFALSIYELGVSHMNGWGIEQDKVLALRCFEIAGAWGDGDALAEAGFCYAQGLGCKKDLKKSARFYRLAEGKGISMVGNSWIYKNKYQDSGAQKLPMTSPDKKPRSKSRSRNMFGRMKSSN